jgi:hypothetical protein
MLKIILPPAPSEVDIVIAEVQMLAVRPSPAWHGLTAAETAELETRIDATEREFATTVRPRKRG